MSPAAVVGRSISKVVPATRNKVIHRLIGSLDVDGAGTEHSLTDVDTDPFILLDQGFLNQDAKPPFGSHPHRGHSVTTLLFQGKIESWDSFGQARNVLTGPAAYWVDAGSGLFHDESSVIADEDDPTQHVSLCQLWVGVREADRQKPPRVQHQESLPVEDLPDGAGSITYYVGHSSKNTIETPHPILVAMVHQNAGSTYHLPVPASHGGVIINFSGYDLMEATKQSSVDHPASFAGVTPTDTRDVLVLGDDSGESLTIVASPEAPADYLVCLGERNGADEPSFKKLVANGAVIAKSAEEARELATKVEGYAEAGKKGGRFAPFGV